MKNSENEFELELTINKNQEAPYDLGNGYGHLAFVVEDLDAEHTRFTDAGYAPRKLVDFKIMANCWRDSFSLLILMVMKSK